jgi:L-ascorbate metabolism protein UlaG (beta-lactamase superfamily)
LVKHSKEHHPKSPKHFDGKRFHNLYPPVKGHTLQQILRWLKTRQPAPWPKKLPVVQSVPNSRIVGNQVVITFVNHSTLLIQTQGLNILTDPIWSQRCSPSKLYGPKRVRQPGIKWEHLPAIDVVLVSHNHYDHMDISTLRLLNKIHSPAFYVSKENAKFLRKKGLSRVTEMDWWEHKPLANKIKLTFVPAQHFSGRGLFDRNKTLWGGFVIESSSPTLYFAGDTAFGTHFEKIREVFGPIGIAMLPIGAFLPRWFMAKVHMSPEEAVQAHQLLQARYSIGIHHGTFPLADEPYDAPVKDLQRALQGQKIPKSRFIALNNGQKFILPSHHKE